MPPWNFYDYSHLIRNKNGKQPDGRKRAGIPARVLVLISAILCTALLTQVYMAESGLAGGIVLGAYLTLTPTIAYATVIGRVKKSSHANLSIRSIRFFALVLSLVWGNMMFRVIIPTLDWHGLRAELLAILIASSTAVLASFFMPYMWVEWKEDQPK